LPKTPRINVEDLVGARGFGHIYKPKYTDKKTRERKESAFWWIEYSHEGKRHFVSSKSKNHADAVKLRNEIFKQLWGGRLPWLERREVTLENVLDAALTKARNKGRASVPAMELASARLLGNPSRLGTPKTERQRGIHRRIAGVRLGGTNTFRAGAVTDPVIDAYVAGRLAQKYKPATLNRDLAMLRRALRIAYRTRDEHGQRLIAVIPEIELLEEDNVREGFPTEAEYQAIRARLPPILQGLADFYRVTGYRKREPLRITIDMVDEREGVIMLSPRLAKSRQWRANWPYKKHPVLRAAIERQLELRGEIELARGIIISTLFFWEDGRPIKSFRSAWTKASAAAGYAHRLVHDFRRMAARDLAKSCRNRKVARRLLGAKTDSIFDRYNIVTEEDEGAAVEALADFHEAAETVRPRVEPLAKKKKGGGAV
jgi:integrase